LAASYEELSLAEQHTGRLVVSSRTKPLGIAVHGHIIVGKTGHASLKGLQLI
jgi:DNA repair protein RadC